MMGSMIMGSGGSSISLRLLRTGTAPLLVAFVLLVFILASAGLLAAVDRQFALPLFLGMALQCLAA